jgi:hypothetical protein
MPAHRQEDVNAANTALQATCTEKRAKHRPAEHIWAPKEWVHTCTGRVADASALKLMTFPFPLGLRACPAAPGCCWSAPGDLRPCRPAVSA